MSSDSDSYILTDSSLVTVGYYCILANEDPLRNNGPPTLWAQVSAKI